jgi:uncharacterized membrane protein YkoI
MRDMNGRKRPRRVYMNVSKNRYLAATAFVFALLLSLTLVGCAPAGGANGSSETKEKAATEETQKADDAAEPAKAEEPGATKEPGSAEGETPSKTTSPVDTTYEVQDCQEIAYKHAGVEASKATFVEDEVETEHGIIEYSFEFYVDDIEYDYEIDMNTGEILDWSKEARTQR